ncbi:MAG: hypothetical protein CVU30_17240 [Betaproteobacteria bacterium HGW-Betaproteobacteria-3]|jgi:hypothetical protein|nr:MAG: hypothetical protein CVU30_17240 [Betaproteobacteria bacterium HGW-Betaproteobacteria-3]
MRRAAWLGAIWLVLWLPPVAPWLTGTMTAHMLVQIPLFVVIGVRLGSMQDCGIDAMRPYRWALLLLAGATLMVWMIPRMLDLAVQSWTVDVAKAGTLTLAGMALRLAWQASGPVVRGLLHVEALATIWRLGWLYLDSPTRLCLQYGQDDQARLGAALLVSGALYAAWLAARGLGVIPVVSLRMHWRS